MSPTRWRRWRSEIGVVMKLRRRPAPVASPATATNLLRVAENLIENAIKYGAPADGERRPQGQARSGGARTAMASLEVRDYGPRHRARASAAADRALLPGRRRPEPGEGRHRPRARDRQAHPGPPSRPARRSLGSPERGATFTAFDSASPSPERRSSTALVIAIVMPICLRSR